MRDRRRMLTVLLAIAAMARPAMACAAQTLAQRADMLAPYAQYNAPAARGPVAPTG